MQNWLQIITLSALFLLVACSQKSLSLFFDLPPPTPEEIAQSKAAKQPPPSAEQQAATTVQEEVPAAVKEIENAKTWEEAEKLLPVNKLGVRDWALALKQSIVQPRSEIGGKRKQDSVFKFDFYIKGEYPALDAHFPHSTHTEHLDCASCHPKLFPYRGSKINMERILSGEYCGFCHGPVAFPVTPENCARCHTWMYGGQQ